MEMKKQMHQKMLQMNQKQELGKIEGETKQTTALIQKQINRPIVFDQDNGYNPMDDEHAFSQDEMDESFDFKSH